MVFVWMMVVFKIMKKICESKKSPPSCQYHSKKWMELIKYTVKKIATTKILLLQSNDVNTKEI